MKWAELENFGPWVRPKMGFELEAKRRKKTLKNLAFQACTLSFFYKQLLYKQLGSDFLKAKQFSASDLRIFSNFACFETCY